MPICKGPNQNSLLQILIEDTTNNRPNFDLNEKFNNGIIRLDPTCKILTKLQLPNLLENLKDPIIKL